MESKDRPLVGTPLTDPDTTLDPPTMFIAEPAEDTEPGPDQEETGKQSAKDKVGAMTDQVKEKAEAGQEKVDEFAQQAEQKTDAGLQKSAEGLKKAADKARAVSEERNGTVASVSTQAADALEKGADYLEKNDTEQLIQELESLVRRRPMESLLVAAGVGFIFSKAVR